MLRWKWKQSCKSMHLTYSYLRLAKGYVTSTNIKVLAMVSESMDPNRELNLKALFAKVHNLFVEYMLNPWTTLQCRIKSSRFEEGVDEAVRVYNESNGIAWA
jgi:hypothetical protein